MTFSKTFEPLIGALLRNHRAWEASFDAFDSREGPSLPGSIDAALGELQARLTENYPHFHPSYAGQMLKPPHEAALLGWLAAALINPNNHAKDGGRATIRLERECIEELRAMVGLPAEGLGHLTSGGTAANLEALFIAREEAPQKAIACSEDAHYTHARVGHLLGTEVHKVRAKVDGTMDPSDLEALCKRARIGTVVATLGTTAFGALDPLDDILELAQRYGFRVHIDAAYGGYFRLLRGDHVSLNAPSESSASEKSTWGRDDSLSAFDRMHEADSIVIDPHKHGLQPYGCGAVLYREAEVARHLVHDAGYTYFSSSDWHPGQTTLECSRAGATAAALWLTMRVVPQDTMRASLAQGLRTARRFAERLRASSRLELLLPPSLDIVNYFPRARSTSEVTRLSNRIFSLGEIESPFLYVAKLTLAATRLRALHPEINIDSEEVVVLRSCLMKPSHEAHLDFISERLEELAEKAARG